MPSAGEYALKNFKHKGNRSSVYRLLIADYGYGPRILSHGVLYTAIHRRRILPMYTLFQALCVLA